MNAHRILSAGTVLPPMVDAVADASPEELSSVSGRPPVAVPTKADTIASAQGSPAATAAERQPRSRRGYPGRDRRPQDRFRVLNAFVDEQMCSVSPNAAKAWFVLYRDTKPDGLARTGLSDMAARMGCSVSTAKRAVRELRKRNLVTPVRKGAPGRGPNVYSVNATADPARGSLVAISARPTGAKGAPKSIDRGHR